MDAILPARDAEGRALFCSLAGPSPLAPEDLERHRPDGSWMVQNADGAVVARCSLWWTHVPAHEPHRLGLIGHYAARDGAAAGRLLRFACEELAARGCTLAVGPMDGSTWRRYRLLTERGDEPPFFLEPDNPDDWPGHFIAEGFAPLAHYVSALDPDTGRPEPRLPEWEEHAARAGIALRPLEAGRFRDELRRIHEVAVAGFARNFLYTPIGLEDFLALYEGIEPVLRPELVLLAEQGGRAVGFLFAVPDLAQARRGRDIDTVIIKTVGVRPELMGQGLGSLLAARCRAEAHRLGYRRAIHALMHEENRSRRISGHTAEVIRGYTLYARPLGPRP